MGKSLGNLFFTVGADAGKFNSEMKRVQETAKETEKQYRTNIIRIIDSEGKLQKTIIKHTEVSKRDAAETTKGQKQMSLGFAAAAGAAAAFAFELIKSSALAQFAMGAAADVIEAAIVTSADEIGAGVATAKKGWEDLGVASDHYAKGMKGSAKEVHTAAQEMGTGIETTIDGIMKVLPGPGAMLNDWKNKAKNELPESHRSGMGIMIEIWTRGHLDMDIAAENWRKRMIAGTGEIGRRWGVFTSDMGHKWQGAMDGAGAAWGDFTHLLVTVWNGLSWGVSKAWEGIQSGWGAFQTWATGAWSAISWAGGGVWESIKAGWSGFTSWLSSKWNEFWEGAKAAGTGAADALGKLIPKFQQGGYVSHTGLAYVHAGEYVTPANQVNNVNNSRSMNVPQIIVNVNSPQGLSFGGGVALGQDTRVAVVEAMRNVVGV